MVKIIPIQIKDIEIMMIIGMIKLIIEIIPVPMIIMITFLGMKIVIIIIINLNMMIII